jgi:hypothetical protein
MKHWKRERKYDVSQPILKKELKAQKQKISFRWKKKTSYLNLKEQIHYLLAQQNENSTR